MTSYFILLVVSSSLLISPTYSALLKDKNGHSLPVLKASFSSYVIDFLSKTNLKLTFKNNLDTELIEVIYTQPMDPDAAVFQMKVDVGDRIVEAEIKEKEEAKRSYKNAIQSGKGAYLAEKDQTQSDVFHFSIGNIRPNEEVVVHLSYVAEVILDENCQDGSTLRFSIPLGICHRYTPALSSSMEFQGAGTNFMGSKHNVPIDVAVDISMPCAITTLSSPSSSSLTVHFDQYTRRRATISAQTSSSVGDFIILIGRAESYKSYLWLPDFTFPPAATGASTGATIGTLSAEKKRPADSSWESMAMISLQPKVSTTYSTDQIVDVIFIVDRSGSMQGQYINTAGVTLAACVASLPLNTRFQIIGFGSSHQLLFPGSELVSFDDNTKAIAMDYAKNLDANFGGTELKGPISFVSSLRHGDAPRNILLITDGGVSNAQEIIDLVKENNVMSGTRYFTFGIGTGASRGLLEGCAKEGGGTAEMIDDVDARSGKVEEKVLRQLARILAPSLSKVRVDLTVAHATLSSTIGGSSNAAAGTKGSADKFGGSIVEQYPQSLPPLLPNTRQLVFFETSVPSAVLLARAAHSAALSVTDSQVDHWKKQMQIMQRQQQQQKLQKSQSQSQSEKYVAALDAVMRATAPAKFEVLRDSDTKSTVVKALGSNSPASTSIGSSSTVLASSWSVAASLSAFAASASSANLREDELWAYIWQCSIGYIWLGVGCQQMQVQVQPPVGDATATSTATAAAAATPDGGDEVAWVSFPTAGSADAVGDASEIYNRGTDQGKVGGQGTGRPGQQAATLATISGVTPDGILTERIFATGVRLMDRETLRIFAARAKIRDQEAMHAYHLRVGNTKKAEAAKYRTIATSIETGILCRWTSFLAIEKSDRRDTDWKAPRQPSAARTFRVYSSRNSGGSKDDDYWTVNNGNFLAQSSNRYTTKAMAKSSRRSSSRSGGSSLLGMAQSLMLPERMAKSAPVADAVALRSFAAPATATGATFTAEAEYMSLAPESIATASRVAGASGAAAVAPISAAGRNVVLAILTLQSAAGHWESTPALWGALQTDGGLGSGLGVATAATSPPAGLSTSVWATLVVLLYLREQQPGHRTLWSLPASKALRYLARTAGWQLSATFLDVSGRPSATAAAAAAAVTRATEATAAGLPTLSTSTSGGIPLDVLSSALECIKALKG